MIVSPNGATHHSLECALAAAFPHGASFVATAAEAFLVHVGSSWCVPSLHFFLNKHYCYEFVSGDSNTVLFGRVVACMAPRGGDGAGAGKGPIFAVSYDRGALAVSETGGDPTDPASRARAGVGGVRVARAQDVLPTRLAEDHRADPGADPWSRLRSVKAAMQETMQLADDACRQVTRRSGSQAGRQHIL